MKPGLARLVSISSILLVCVGAGSFTWLISNKLSGYPNQQALYYSQNETLLTKLSTNPPAPIGWADLLPDADKATIEKYQSTSPASLEDKLLSTIEASFDKTYQTSLQSNVTVPRLNGQTVSIKGYIVPIEANSERKITRFFLVPYFGACMHFPPPAPNQMVYVTSNGGFSLANIQSAYQVSGIIRHAMYEDPLGTAAYVMDAVFITSYSGEPDDVRSHPS
ncbi:MAG: DUF3299 domain-containing protein [Alteromonadaceae bacterium]|nr:DUF3299 domain-containing protein [Alteromonadaceae bacterium]